MMKKLFLTLLLLAASVAATQAQSNPEQAVLNAREQFSNIKNRSIELERMKREANKRPASDSSTTRFPEIKEDFEQIQKINADVIELTATKSPVDYSAVSKFVAEINHRAVRLKSNLFPVEPKVDKKAKNKSQVPESQDLKTLLNALDKRVDTFVHSPMFQNINLVNPTDSLAAQKDLEAIIYLSGAIKAQTKN